MRAIARSASVELNGGLVVLVFFKERDGEREREGFWGWVVEGGDGE